MPPDTSTEIPIPSYALNHPKNYLGWMVCLKKADGDRDEADRLCEEYVTGAPDIARRGAMNLGLVESPTRGEYQLTEHATHVCTLLLRDIPGNNYSQVLEYIQDLKGSSKRFVEAVEAWSETGPTIMLAEPATNRLVELMVEADATTDHSLNELVAELAEYDPWFVARYFLRDYDETRERVLGIGPIEEFEPGSFDIDSAPLEEDLDVYRNATIHMHKSVQFHLGVMTTTGKDPKSDFDPTEFMWELEPGIAERYE